LNGSTETYAKLILRNIMVYGLVNL